MRNKVLTAAFMGLVLIIAFMGHWQISQRNNDIGIIDLTTQDVIPLQINPNNKNNGQVELSMSGEVPIRNRNGKILAWGATDRSRGCFFGQIFANLEEESRIGIINLKTGAINPITKEAAMVTMGDFCIFWHYQDRADSGGGISGYDFMAFYCPSK